MERALILPFDEDNDDLDNDDDDVVDIYIMMSVCLFVTKNHHFLCE